MYTRFMTATRLPVLILLSACLIALGVLGAGTTDAQEAEGGTITPGPDGVYTILLPAIDNTPSEANWSQMVQIHAGTFTMGCDASVLIPSLELCNEQFEPLRQVTLSPYAIDKYEVTNGRYKKCVDAGVCTRPSLPLFHYDTFGNPRFATHAVALVVHEQAEQFCAWEGKRLPTVAEWERAARGDDDTRKYPWGNDAPTCRHGEFTASRGIPGDEWGVCGPLPDVPNTVRPFYPVGSHLDGESPWGVMDMIGGVEEFTSDYFGIPDPTDNIDPKGPPPSLAGYRTIKGFASDYFVFRTGRAIGTDNVRGFRCAMSAH